MVLNYDQDTSRVIFNGDIQDDLSGFDYLWLRLANQEASEHVWLDVADWSINWDENEEFTQRASFSWLNEDLIYVGHLCDHGCTTQ